MSRRANDFYPTPESATRALLQRITPFGQVYEPCCGEFDIVLPLREAGLQVSTNDIDPQMPAGSHFDATSNAAWVGRPIDWTITNPPFSHAFPILQHAYRYSRYGVAMLLRLSFLEPCLNRAEWLEAHPPNHLIVLPRISFTGDGKTDSVTAAWMVWQTSRITHQVIEVVTRQEMGALQAAARLGRAA